VYTLRNTYAIAAVNISLGSGAFANQALCDRMNAAYKAAIDSLRSVNIATIIGSGNNANPNRITAPACVSSAIAVGSVGDSDVVSAFSNGGILLDLLAPGENINSSIPGNGFQVLQGTSMAAPHVAGAWAVLRERYPNRSVSDILRALRVGGVPIIDTRTGRAYPRIDFTNALEALPDNDPRRAPAVISEDFLVVTFTQTNIAGALQTRDEPRPTCIHPTTPVSHSVWYAYSPTSRGMMYLDTAGSNYNTILVVFRASPQGLRQVACNNNPSAATNRAALVLRFQPNAHYRILVARVGRATISPLMLNLSVNIEEDLIP
jgi:hypothetical protein